MTLPPRNYGNRNRTARLERPTYRKWIRTFRCACWGNPHGPCDIDHGVEAAHYRSAENAGMGMKPSDFWLIPLCRFHHAEQHRIGQPAFEARYGFSMREKALEFALSPKNSDGAIKAAAKAFLAERL